MVAPQFSSEITVSLVDSLASDERVAQAARVSSMVVNADAPVAGCEGLIRFLMRNRHGSPFEHNSFTFLVHAPIFVAREWMRHRVGFSYNEQSGRYMELPGLFYVPDEVRKVVRALDTKVGDYDYVALPALARSAARAIVASSSVAWRTYEEMLLLEVVPEVARMCLPVNLFTSFYVTCNARSIMSFLELRTEVSDATFPSKPLHEIDVAARQVEAFFAAEMPLTHAAWDSNGRVSP
jgi:thymidylate synthase (FAD)